MSEHGASFAVAAEAASAGNVFTTHTPVPAGNDAFARDLIALISRCSAKASASTTPR
jgi:glucan phosphorylase